MLLISLSIFVATSVVVALFGVVPLPEYEDLTSENKMSGKLIYHVEIQSGYGHLVYFWPLSFRQKCLCLGSCWQTLL